MMNLYLTTGTINYFLNAKKDGGNFFLNGNGERGIAYYEAEASQGLFKTGEEFEISHTHGELSEKNTMLVTHINTSAQKRAAARTKVNDLIDGLETTNGVQAYRVGKMQDKYSFVIVVQFINSDAYKAFSKSDLYESTISNEALKSLRDEESMFSNANSRSYYVPIKDLDEEDLEDSF